MLIALLYLIAGTLVVTPEAWQSAAISGGSEKTSVNFDQRKVDKVQKIDMIRTDFENRINDILGENSQYSAFTFVVRKVDGNVLYVDGDSPDGYSKLVLPATVRVYNIKSVRVGKDGKKHFGFMPLASLEDKVPFILGLVGDINYQPDGTIKILKLEQVFYIGRAE